MLSPFKTFLSTLQKNGVTIFKRSSPSEQSTTAPSDAGDGSGAGEVEHDEHTAQVPLPEAHEDAPLPLPALAHCDAAPDATPVEFQIADDQMSQQSCDDPLSDPLALEDRLHYDSGLLVADCAVHAESYTEVTLVDVSSLTQAEIDQLETDSTIRGPTVADEAGVVLQFEEGAANLVDLASEETGVEEAGVRSDGSDSGLGQESTNSSLAPCDITPMRTPIAPTPRRPLRTALKRRSDHITDPTDTFGDVDSNAISANTTAKRPKRNIHFNDVTVYYFQRQQGFMCVPSQGGCSLGMAATHSYRRRFTLAEYAAEQRRVQRHKAQELKRSAGLPVSSSEDSAGGSDDECNGDANYEAPGPSGGPPAACTSDQPNSDSDDAESMGIQPVSARQRRIMLKAAGVRKIDASEKKECRDILQSRDNCGCNCRGFCDPETCACAQSGIKCQVDRLHYPCGCTRDGCGNPVGRAEFNKARVKTHYIHTFLRLQLESKPPLQRPEVEMLLNPPPMSASTSSTIGNWNLQMGRSLAAMSGDNLYNMNGATTVISAVPTTTMLAAHDIMPLQLDQTPDLHYAYGDDVYDTALSTTATPIHGSSGAVGQFDCYASGTSASGSGSGLNTPTNMCDSPAAPAFAVLSAATSSSMYSPDSASIVEPTPHETTSTHQAHNDYNPPKYPTSSTCSSQSYPDYGNITGYQHSYLYSLQKQQAPQQLHDAPPAPALQDHTSSTGYQHSYLYSLMQHKQTSPTVAPEDKGGLFEACTSVPNDTGMNNGDDDDAAATILELEFEVDFSDDSTAVADDGLNTLTAFFEAPSDNSAVANNRSDFELEPIDFESELGLATTFIDKSLKTCVTPPSAAILATLSESSTVATSPATTASNVDETNN